MVTVEMPMVCVTDAAGLGTRGEVITPCAKDVVKSSRKSSVAADVVVYDFSISCVLNEQKLNLLRLKTLVAYIILKPK